MTRHAGRRWVAAPVAALIIAGAALPAAGAAGPPPLFLPALGIEAAAVAPPEYSRPRGYQERPFQLALSAPAGYAIQFTVDGSRPGLATGRPYRGPITIDRNLTVRAVAFRPGPGAARAMSSVATQTYLFPDSVFRQPAAPPGFPSDWGIPPEMAELGPVAADYAMDGRVIDDPRYAPQLGRALRALPALAVTMDPDDLFGPRRGIYVHATGEGQAWERPASVELMEPDGATGFQVDAGIRIAGVASRHHQFTPKHSFSLRFRSGYGDARLDYPMFPRSGVDRFDTLRLRAHFNDSFNFLPRRGQFLRDAWARETQRAMGWLAPEGRFCHLFLNGLYWGVYEIAEEPTAAFAADHLGGREEDYDVVKTSERGEGGLEDGSREAYERLIGLRDLADPVRYRQVAELLDIPAFVDYMLLSIYALNLDWQTNWRAARHRYAGPGFRFFSWDAEISLDLLQPGHRLYQPSLEDDMSVTQGVDGLHDRLMRSLEYRQTFADRARIHLFGDGALTDGQAAARYRRLAARIQDPLILESARWGDSPPGGLALRDGGALWSDFFALRGAGSPQTRDGEWVVERDRLLREYFPRRRERVLWQLCDRVLFPPLAAPVLDPAGGPMPATSRLVMRPDDGGCAGADRRGTIYYTTDGSDPREPFSGHNDIPWSGLVAHGARAYRSPLSLSEYSVVKARAALPVQGRLLWSALTEARFGAPRLAIDEVMYRPAGQGQSLEFLEIVNRERLPVDLSGAYTEGVTYTFPAGSIVPPEGRVVLVRDPQAFAQRHPTVRIAGGYSGRLSDEGEVVTLHDADDQVLARSAYGVDGFWPRSPAGMGYSLVRAPAGWSPGDGSDRPEDWRSSARTGGSPGQPDPPPAHGPVIIGEILVRPESPGLQEAIELFNPGPPAADLGGWCLGTAPERLCQHRLPSGTHLAAGQRAVFFAADWAEDPSPLRLGDAGGTVFLSGVDILGRPDGSIHGFDYGAAAPDQAFGRLETVAGPVVAPLRELSFGAANGGPRSGPIILSEIMYHPADPAAPEWVELLNVSDEPVDLGHGAASPGGADEPWRLAGGLSFAFPVEARLEPGQRGLVSPEAPALFRRLRGIPDEVPVWGPWRRKLGNEGDRLLLGYPSDRAAGGQESLIEVDRLVYADSAPWPPAADGDGPSLERIDAVRWGDDPAAWAALSAGGTPGRDNTIPRRIWLPMQLRSR